MSTSAPIPGLGPESADFAAFDDDERPPAPPPAAPPPPPPPPPISAAVGYLFDQGGVSRQYRVAIDILRADPRLEPRFDTLPLASPTALRLAATQRPDGGWGGGALTLPDAAADDGLQGVGLIPGVRRLVELGWDADSPPIHLARRVLFRLLAEDDDPALRFEFAGTTERVLAVRQRLLLREAAAATLAHAGLETDPRVRGAAHRLLDRVMQWLRSPKVASAWTTQGKQAVLAPEAAPPSVFLLQMLAFMPQFRSEQHQAVSRLLAYLSKPAPHAAWVQRIGTQLVPQPYLVVGDPLAAPSAPDLPTTLGWLELFARLGALRRHAPWGEQFDALLEERDEGAVWRPATKRGLPTASTDPAWWHAFSLGEGAVDWSAEVTFRLALIARLSGRTLSYR